MKRLFIAFSLLITFLCISTETEAQTQRTRTYLHGRFETGDFPTQTDYRDVFATFFSRLEDSLSISVLYGVDTISNDVTLADSSTVALVTEAAVKGYVDAAAGSVTNGDKGDITVTAGVWTIDNDAVDAAAIATGAVGTSEIANNSVANADLATMATNTLKGNDDVGTATPQDLTTAEVKTMLAIGSTDVTDFEEATEDLIGANIVAGSGVSVAYDDGTGNTTITATSLSDGDKGDIDVTGSGTTWSIDTSAVEYNMLSDAVKDSITTILDGDKGDIVISGGTWLIDKATDKDTITQNSHGFSVMDAVLDTGITTTPKYITGNTSSASLLPSHIVVDSIDANTFAIQRSGYFKGTQTTYTTKQIYYLQDDGSYADTPDATYNFPVFAITPSSTIIYLSLLPGSVSPTTVDSLFELSSQTIFGTSENVIKLSTARTSGSYNQHLLFGGPTVDVPGSTGADENEYSRIMYFNQDRAFFGAGRVNTITDIGGGTLKQWDGGRVAQYSAAFGWNNYPYGGYSSVNGALGKGQTIAGYQNRSIDAYAQTFGQNNINGSFKGSIIGAENVIGRTMYDFSRYDTTTSTAYVATDVSAEFPVNSLVISRTLDTTNNYYVPASAYVSSVSYNGGTDTTTIVFDRKYFNITDYFQSSGQLIRGEPGIGTYSNHARGSLNYIPGATNVVDGVSNTVSGERNYVTGKSNTVTGNDSHADCSTCEITVNNSWAFGSQVKNDIAASIAYAMGGFSNVRGSAQTFIIPSKLDFTTSGNIDIPMPDSSTWTVRADFALAEYSVGNQQGGFSLFFTCYRDGTGNTTILGSPTTTYTAGTPGTWTASVSGSTTNLRISLSVDSGKDIKAYGSVNIQQVIE